MTKGTLWFHSHSPYCAMLPLNKDSTLVTSLTLMNLSSALLTFTLTLMRAQLLFSSYAELTLDNKVLVTSLTLTVNNLRAAQELKWRHISNETLQV